MKSVTLIIIGLLSFTTLVSSQSKYNSTKQKQNLNTTQLLSDIEFTTINQMRMTVSNTSTGVPIGMRDGGVKWPGGRNAFKEIIFYDGFQLVGKINGELTCIGANPIIFNGGNNLQPGRIYDDGTPANPENPRFRIYKIQKGWETTPFGNLRDKLETDYNTWPVQDGAPWVDVDGDGFFSRGVDQPEFIGDEVLFYVGNDADTNVKPYIQELDERLKPMNVEVQVTVFGKQGAGSLGDVIYKRYKIINKGSQPIEELYFSVNSDSEAGGYTDDLGACDTTLNLGYVYNGDSNDDRFGDIPPAIGHVLIQGPRIPAGISDSAFFEGKWIKGFKNLDMTSFNYFVGYLPRPDDIPPEIYYKYKYVDPGNVEQLYNTVRGNLAYGQPQLAPDGNPTPFALSGDPVTGTGWYDNPSAWPGYDSLSVGPQDVRYQFSSGPTYLAPFDTNEVVIALVAAIGADRLDSITELRKKAQAAKTAYYSNFETVPPVPQPVVHKYEENKSFTLWWNTVAEQYDEVDIFLDGYDKVDSTFIDTTYTFEGYIIEQYEDSLGSNPEPVAIFDRVNGVTVIESEVIANGVSTRLPVIYGSDSGLQRYIDIEKDSYTNRELLDGNEYYFGVTAYTYSRNSSPTFVKSKPSIIEVIPGKRKVDYSSLYKQDQDVLSNQIKGDTDASVKTKIIDPASITMDNYLVEFHKETEGLFYDLINTSKNDTLIKNGSNYESNSTHQPVYNGFILLVDNYGKDSINTIDDENVSAIKEILEIKNEDGYLEEPTSVLNNTSSNGEWNISAGGIGSTPREQLNWTGSIGYDTYEIRFTSQGSEYYTTGYGILFSERNDDPKGKGRVPFEIWRLSRDGSEEERMIIKIHDRELRDTTWTKDELTNRWEMIYAYIPDVKYNEPLPETSGKSELSQHRFGRLVIEGEIPKEGTVIRITTFRPLTDGDKYEIELQPANFSDTEAGKESKDEISVFPNPFFAGNNSTDQKYMRFLGVPSKTTVRIFTLSGQLVRRIEKDDQKKFIDWDLRNENGQIVSSGMYVAYLDMPGIGSKIFKLAVVPSTEFLDIQ